MLKLDGCNNSQVKGTSQNDTQEKTVASSNGIYMAVAIGLFGMTNITVYFLLIGHQIIYLVA